MNTVSHISYNARLILTDEQKSKILTMLEAQRKAWNECSKVRFEKVSKNSIVELHKQFYQDFRDRNPDIPAQLVISAENSVLSAYRSAKSNKHKLKSPYVKKSLSLRLDKRSYSYKKIGEDFVFSVISLDKRVKCGIQLYSKLSELLGKHKFCDPSLFVKNGEVWITLSFKIPLLLPKTRTALGIDLGCRVLAATSDGNLYVDKNFNARKRRIRYLKRCLQSKGTKSAKCHLSKIKHKEHNLNKNFSHHLANKILLDVKADVLVLEDVTGIKKKKKFENKNRISQVPFYLLKQLLTYKAALLPEPKTVISVNPSFTSQLDCKTGIKDGVRKGRRYYAKSGEVYDADVNAAVNIGKRSKLPVSYNSILDGQAVVTRLNFCKGSFLQKNVCKSCFAVSNYGLESITSLRL